MPNRLDQFRPGFRADHGTHIAALTAVLRIDAHLDQLMMVQGCVDFKQHGRANAGLSGYNDGFQRMGLGAELFLQCWFQTIVLLFTKV